MNFFWGNSKTVMITNISPGNYNIEGILTTLRYSDRDKNIEKAHKVNEESKVAVIKKRWIKTIKSSFS